MCLNEITRANVMEIKSIAAPHPLIEKTMQIVLALRGYKALSWANSRDLLGRTSLVAELRGTDYKHLKSEDVLRA